MPKDEVDFDALGLSDEELGIAPERGRGGGADGGGRKGSERGRGGGRGRGRLLLFLVGLMLGVAGALLLPRFLGPYLPAAFRGGEGETVEGEVLGKRRDGERLLLTVETSRGAVLATFRKRVAEIDLLVDEGDSVALGLGRYRPFVEDPSVEGVRKAAAGRGSAGEPGASTNGGGAPPGPGRVAAPPDTTAAPPDTTG